MLEHLLSFFISPNFLVSHLLGAGMMTGLVLQGIPWRRLLMVAMLEELLVPVVWGLVPASLQGLGVVFTLYVVIKLYERLSGPRVKIEEGAVFLAGKC